MALGVQEADEPGTGNLFAIVVVTNTLPQPWGDHPPDLTQPQEVPLCN